MAPSCRRVTHSRGASIDRLDSLAAALTAYPLYPYIAAWQLRSRLAERLP